MSESSRAEWPLAGYTRRRLVPLLGREWSITEASTLMMAAFLLSAMLGVVRQVLFNARFGAGIEANAYYAAARLPDTLFSLIAGGALSSAMIPVLLSTRREQGEQAAHRLMSLVMTALLVVLALVVLASLIFAPQFVRNVLAPGFDEPTTRLTVRLTRLMLLEPLILAGSAVAGAVLQSRNQFSLPALSAISHNFTIISGIVLAMLFPKVGIYGPTLGVLVGAVLHVLILAPGLFEGNRGFRLAWDSRDRRLREVVRLLIPNGLSVGVGYAGTIVDTAFVSLVREPTALPAVQNAWMLTSLPITLLGHAIGLSAFPRLAAYVVSAKWSRLRQILLQTLAAGFVLAVPAVIGLIALGRPLIRLLFEHGRFDAAAGSLTYLVLVPYVVALPCYIATEVVTRGLIALRDTRTPLITNSLQLAGRAGLIALLLGRLGVLAIPVAFAITASLETLVLAAVLAHKIRNRRLGGGA